MAILYFSDILRKYSPKAMIPEDVIRIESKWKARLLSAKFGMNDN